MPSVSEPLHRVLGLTDDEAGRINQILERPANGLELAMYSVMWSEHCSYKSSRIHLKRLPTEAPWVLVGPGENAGVVDVGDGIAVAIRIESHNHPSAIEPYQGAATGVGGILRDVFTMGARPIALMDPLRFGPLDDARSRWIAEGVVSGISGYGNAVGVPTVGGEVVFDETYRGNPLVNVLCLGTLPIERLVLGRASGVGNLAVLLGSSTGRDGIGGVSVLASTGFSDDDDGDKRPSVQVGDPYEEKRLIEACLQLLDEGLVIGIQDLGGAGLTCATSETASRGGVGIDVDVSVIPRREPCMEPHEVMISESQERMLAIVEPDDLDRLLEICELWEVAATAIGRVTDGGSLRILDGFDGEVLADVPAASLHEDAPLYDRPRKAPLEQRGPMADELATPDDLGAELIGLLADPSWVYRQYDHQLFLNTVVGPGDDAAVLKLRHPTTGADTGRALAITTDGSHHWCSVDPRAGTAQVVAESVLNLACVGARPLAVVNCLNFGNPENPEVMWQFSESVDGIGEACRAFNVPVIGGNVSLYNESGGTDIDPTPVIGLLGVVDDLRQRPPGARLVDGHRLIVLGPDTKSLGGSLWAASHGSPGGDLSPLDTDLHLRVAGLVRTLVRDGLVGGVHDISSGGVGVAIAEMVSRSGVGAHLARIADHRDLFGEGPSRVIVAVDPECLAEVFAAAKDYEVPTSRIGLATGDRLIIKNLLDISIADIRFAFEGRLPEALGSGTTNR